MNKPTDEDVMRWASLGLSNGLRDDMSEPREWLAGVKAEARAEGHKAGYRSARADMLSGAFIGGPTYEALRDSFTGQQIAREAREPASHDTDRSPE